MISIAMQCKEVSFYRLYMFANTSSFNSYKSFKRILTPWAALVFTFLFLEATAMISLLVHHLFILWHFILTLLHGMQFYWQCQELIFERFCLYCSYFCYHLLLDLLDKPVGDFFFVVIFVFDWHYFGNTSQACQIKSSWVYPDVPWISFQAV